MLDACISGCSSKELNPLILRHLYRYTVVCTDNIHLSSGTNLELEFLAMEILLRTSYYHNRINAYISNCSFVTLVTRPLRSCKEYLTIYTDHVPISAIIVLDLETTYY